MGEANFAVLLKLSPWRCSTFFSKREHRNVILLVLCMLFNKHKRSWNDLVKPTMDHETPARRRRRRQNKHQQLTGNKWSKIDVKSWWSLVPCRGFQRVEPSLIKIAMIMIMIPIFANPARYLQRQILWIDKKKVTSWVTQKFWHFIAALFTKLTRFPKLSWLSRRSCQK